MSWKLLTIKELDSFMFVHLPILTLAICFLMFLFTNF